MSKKQKADALACRRNKVGGEAVLEGVMMKAGERYCVATRMEDGNIRLTEDRFESVRKRHKALNIPVLRGIVNFVEMMRLSYRSLNISAEALGIEEEDSKAEKWLREKFGRGIMDIVMVVGMVLGLALGVGLFFFLPMLTTKAVDNALDGSLGFWKNVMEGVLRIGIFILYILLVSLMRDIRRTFEYHGAEHKSIFCYESGEPLTVENVRKQRRFHPRCGTSFIFVILILSIIVFSFVTWDNIYIRLCLKLPLLPVIVGVGYEFIMYAGKHENLLTRILSAPGLWMQRITTREPDDEQIEVACLSEICVAQ